MVGAITASFRYIQGEFKFLNIPTIRTIIFLMIKNILRHIIVNIFNHDNFKPHSISIKISNQCYHMHQLCIWDGLESRRYKSKRKRDSGADPNYCPHSMQNSPT